MKASPLLVGALNLELSLKLGNFRVALGDDLLKILDATLRSVLAFHLLSTRLTRRLGVTSALSSNRIIGIELNGRQVLARSRVDTCNAGMLDCTGSGNRR